MRGFQCQILVVNDNAFILDFEGEPKPCLVERRMKSPAARDVTGIIRSVDYAVTGALDRTAKAIDEIGYELSNSPTWLHAPREGIRRILKSRGLLP